MRQYLKEKASLDQRETPCGSEKVNCQQNSFIKTMG